MSFRRAPADAQSSDTEKEGFQLESVFENEVFADYFVKFLTNNFEVEDYLFITEVRTT